MFIVFDSARRHKNSDYSKESNKIDAKIRETHQHVTSEHRAARDVPLSKVPLPFRASVQAFSKKCGFFRVLRCSLVGLAGLIRWCTCYQHSEVQFVFMKNPWNAECIKMRAKFDPIYSVKVPPPQKTLHPGHQGFRYGPLSKQIFTGKNMCFSNVKYSISSPERGDRKIASQGYSAVCAWFCVSWSVLPVSDWVCAVQCQHGTSGDCV